MRSPSPSSSPSAATGGPVAQDRHASTAHLAARANQGFVYVATGERYVREAANSAASLRCHHPNTPICLITDEARGTPFWDDLILIAAPRFTFRDKLAMCQAPYDRAIFLDTDTTIVGDLSQLFTVLSRYDICGVQLSEGQDYVMEGGIPHAFPEMNGGIIGFRAGAATDEFFALWARYYDDFLALNRDGRYHYANVGDQKSLRAALWHSRVRHAAIGAEFNFIPFRVELVSLPVAVIHTRAPNVPALAPRLNAQLGRRTYVPALDVLLTDTTPTSELRRLASASLRQLARRALRRAIPGALRGWLHRSTRLRRWFLGNPFASEAGRKELIPRPPT